MPFPTARSTDALAQLELALRDEQHARAQAAQAREALHLALERQAGALRALQSQGITSTVAALHVAKMIGEPTAVQHRLRLAARLRKRASRVTRGHGKLVVPIAGASSAELRSCLKEEANMGRIIRRKIVEEVEEVAKPGEALESELEDDVDEEEDAGVDEEEDAGEDEPEESRSGKPAVKRHKRR